MKFSTGLAIALSAGLITATPVLAQSTNDAGKKPDAASSSTATKRPTTGMPVGAEPKKYGDHANKQKTAGMPVGAEPQKYGTQPKSQ
jgi:hypothetical protein